MKNYEGVTINVVYLSKEDVITASQGNDTWQVDFFME